MFDGLTPEVEALLEAAKSDLPTANADARLLAAMSTAVSSAATSPLVTPRRRSMLGKVLTAKAAVIVGVLALTGGAASAATGTLPAPAQNAAATAAEHVGLHIPKANDQQSGDSTDNNSTDPTSTTVAHPDNHGKDVSTVAHDSSTTGADHGTAVCTVASNGKCQPDASGEGKSAGHRQDGSHSNDGSTTTSTTVAGGPSGDNSGDTSGSHPTQDSHPSETANPGDGHHGSGG